LLMSNLATTEWFEVFDARRVKAPELRGLDLLVNGMVGWVKNRLPVLPRLKKMAERIEKLEPEIRNLGSTRFQEEVTAVREEARLGRMRGPVLERGVALARE